jgi:hypothetical protein
MVHIVVVGLKPNQVQAVRRQDRGGLRWTFIPSGRRETRLPRGADWVLLARFIDHPWHQAATAQMPKGRVVFCPGGMTGLLRELHRVTGWSTSPEPRSR